MAVDIEYCLVKKRGSHIIYSRGMAVDIEYCLVKKRGSHIIYSREVSRPDFESCMLLVGLGDEL